MRCSRFLFPPVRPALHAEPSANLLERSSRDAQRDCCLTLRQRKLGLDELQAHIQGPIAEPDDPCPSRRPCDAGRSGCQVCHSPHSQALSTTLGALPYVSTDFSRGDVPVLVVCREMRRVGLKVRLSSIGCEVSGHSLLRRE